jgi:hypothetical protein
MLLWRGSGRLTAEPGHTVADECKPFCQRLPGPQTAGDLPPGRPGAQSVRSSLIKPLTPLPVDRSAADAASLRQQRRPWRPLRLPLGHGAEADRAARSSTGVSLLVDSVNRGQVSPLILVDFSGGDEPRERWHLDVWVPRTKVQRRVEAAALRYGSALHGTFRGVSLGAGDLRTAVFR